MGGKAIGPLEACCHSELGCKGVRLEWVGGWHPPFLLQAKGKGTGVCRQETEKGTTFEMQINETIIKIKECLEKMTQKN